MKMPSLKIIESLILNLQQNIGRHLYAILGDYSQLEDFEKNYLQNLQIPGEGSDLMIVDVNHALLDCISDEDLRNLVKSETIRPLATQDKLNRVLDALLADLQNNYNVLFLKNLEIIFAYELALQILRARAANNKHIVLLLPGEYHQDHVKLFTEARHQFHRTLPTQLVTENHLWEIQNAN